MSYPFRCWKVCTKQWGLISVLNLMRLGYLFTLTLSSIFWGQLLWRFCPSQAAACSSWSAVECSCHGRLWLSGTDDLSGPDPRRIFENQDSDLELDCVLNEEQCGEWYVGVMGSWQLVLLISQIVTSWTVPLCKMCCIFKRTIFMKFALCHFVNCRLRVLV